MLMPYEIFLALRHPDDEDIYAIWSDDWKTAFYRLHHDNQGPQSHAHLTGQEQVRAWIRDPDHFTDYVTWLNRQHAPRPQESHADV